MQEELLLVLSIKTTPGCCTLVLTLSYTEVNKNEETNTTSN